MSASGQVTVGAVVARIGSVAPWWTAEPWDRVGLLAGDPDAPVTRVHVSLDPTPGALRRAVAAGAQLLACHHPPSVEGALALTPARGLAGVPFSAVAQGVALIAAHTNLDRAPEGASALPATLGLEEIEPLEPGIVPVAVVACQVPPEAASAVADAMAAAGAGSLGRYEGCSFRGPGTGTFTPLEGASPAIGTVGTRSETPEERLEMACPPALAARVAAACRAAHPYEEPVVLVAEGSIALGAARMGRLCRPAAGAGTDLGALARDVGERLGVRPRVWGDAAARVDLVAVAPGSGRSFVGAALAAGAGVLVTGELRYHDALDCVEAGLPVIEAGHDATEWPLAAALARIVEGTPGLAAGAVTADEPSVGWWVG